MTRKTRLMRTIRGEAVDRPAFNFYEINGTEDTRTRSPFNIYTDPSWQPLIELAAEQSDRIVMCRLPLRPESLTASWEQVETRRHLDENGSEHTIRTLKAGRRVLTERQRRDPDINTVWTVEHLLKDVDDFRAWLDLPEPPPEKPEADPTPILEREAKLGDSGIVMLDTPDPLCGVAPCFEMGEYTVIALTEPELMHRALQREARRLLPRVEAAAAAVPGRLWRIFGPEYASPPYLPPALFREYVVTYVKPMVTAIHRHGGYVRLHSHGRLRDILDLICETGCDGLDPIEPPHQGDVDLAYVRDRYGDQLVLFGNLEITDVENLPTPEFEKKVATALAEGPGRRGFVLMPSAAPYGRQLAPHTLANYRAMARLAAG